MSQVFMGETSEATGYAYIYIFGRQKVFILMFYPGKQFPINLSKDN